MSVELESFENFEYIIKSKKEDRICFGSGVKRHTSPIGKGLSSAQRMQVRELFPNTSPGCYYIENITSALYPELNKIRSKLGTFPLCNKAPRFRDWSSYEIPGPGRYTICKFLSKFKQNVKPFGSGVKIIEKKLACVPGPGTYNNSKKIICKRTNFLDNFGVPKPVNAVEIICVNKAKDACQKCDVVCEGDYWQKEYTTFLCQSCMDEELDLHEIYDNKTLNEFKKIRNCSFMHDHQNTKAAIQIIPTKKVRKKVQLENYLTLYM